MDGNAAILVVENHEKTSCPLKAMLAGNGYDVAVIQEDELVVRMLRGNNKIDLVLIDILPGSEMKGIEASEQMLRFSDVPVVYFISSEDKTAADRIRSTRHNGCVPRESGDFFLLSAVETAMRQDREKRGLLMREDMFELVTDSVPVMLAYAGNDERYLYANRRYAEWYGIDVKTIVGKRIADVTGADTYRVLEPYLKRALAGERLTYEYSAKNRQDEERIFRSEYVPRLVNGTVNELVALIADVTEHVNARYKILDLLREKDVLLKEVHHRIKNNMGSIATLLFLQSDSLHDPGSINALQDARGRVLSMMGIYDILYKSGDYKNVDVNEYITYLIEKISNTYLRGMKVRIDKNIDIFFLDSSLLFPVGVIVNELVTNALKYAFTDGRAGLISVRAGRRGDRKIEFVIRDNGIGLNDAFTGGSAPGFGLTMVNMMVQQIKGVIKIGRKDGTEFRITFPV